MYSFFLFWNVKSGPTLETAKILAAYPPHPITHTNTTVAFVVVAVLLHCESVKMNNK